VAVLTLDPGVCQFIVAYFRFHFWLP